jgi:hypothetical protein
VQWGRKQEREAGAGSSEQEEIIFHWSLDIFRSTFSDFLFGSVRVISWIGLHHSATQPIQEVNESVRNENQCKNDKWKMTNGNASSADCLLLLPSGLC